MKMQVTKTSIVLFMLTIVISLSSIGISQSDVNLTGLQLFNNDRIRNTIAVRKEQGVWNMWSTSFGLEREDITPTNAKSGEYIKFCLDVNDEPFPSVTLIDHCSFPMNSAFESANNLVNSVSAYTTADSLAIFSDTSYSQFEKNGRYWGASGCWASPVLDSTNDYVYIINKSGMLMQFDSTAGT